MNYDNTDIGSLDVYTSSFLLLSSYSCSKADLKVWVISGSLSTIRILLENRSYFSLVKVVISAWFLALWLSLDIFVIVHSLCKLVDNKVFIIKLAQISSSEV